MLLLGIAFVFSSCSHKSVSVRLGTARGILIGSYHGCAVHFLFCGMFMFWFVVVLGPRGKRKKHKKIPPTQNKPKN